MSDLPVEGEALDQAEKEQKMNDALNEKVFTALGQASVCWNPMDGTGIFDSERAKEIGDELVAYIDGLLAGKDDLLYRAWTVIANANTTEWGRAKAEQTEWATAAEKWRDDFHAQLDHVPSESSA